MFTGIVEEIGVVRAIRPGQLAISARAVLQGTRPGDSICVNGACLTVTALDGGSFSVDVMPETLRRTNLGGLRAGDRVNLERPLAAGGRLGGHFVQGHVDATGRVLSLTPEEGAVLARFEAPPAVMRYIVDKGFIAVDGVSLTVVEHDATYFAVSLVAYTREHTTLGSRGVGDLVNLEVDTIAKYVERLHPGRGMPGEAPEPAAKPGITTEFLAEHGFGGGLGVPPR